MRQFSKTTTVLVLLWMFCGSTTITAHDLKTGVGTQSFITFTEGRMTVKLNFGVATDHGLKYLDAMDVDDDERVSKEERETWLTVMGEKLVLELDVRANGRPLTFEVTENMAYGIMGKVTSVQFDTFFTLTAELPGQIEGGGWWIHFEDRSCQDLKSSQFICPTFGGSDADTQISYIIFEPDASQYVEEYEWHKIPGRKAVLFVNDNLRWLPGQVEVPSVESLARLELSDSPSVPPVVVEKEKRKEEKTAREITEKKTPEISNPFFTRNHLWVGIACLLVGGFLGTTLRNRP